MNVIPIVEAIKKRKENFGGTDAKLAKSLGINPSQLSQILNGQTERMLSEPKWVDIAFILQVNLDDRKPWMVVETSVFRYITKQLEHCQRNSVSAIMADATDIGKTVAARHYAANNKRVAYVDCSQCKSRIDLIRTIAKAFGVDNNGSVRDVYHRLAHYMRTVGNALTILDEVGDLAYAAALEIKALWNAAEYRCGWFLIGADSLKTKWEKHIERETVGFAELFRRCGSRYQRCTPFIETERKEMMMKMGAQIIKANAPNRKDVDVVLRKTGGSLTRVYLELTKQAA